MAKSSTYKRYIPALFTATIFLSASLLFFVQPLFAKIVLPHIGGTPAVWTTAMLFFQTALIAGYLYAHLLTNHVPVKMQIVIHAVFWVCALLFLPLAIPDGWVYDAERSAVTQTLILFALGVGLPFTALSANAPLIQAWYVKSGGPSADDPYFLYGASNLGSLVSLLAFPLVAEPLFGATGIGTGWAIGFLVLGGMLMLTGLSVSGRQAPKKVAQAGPAGGKPTIGTLAYWCFVAFIPSSLMLAVTTKITTDIGSLPLLWVIPLALYLLSFVVTFRKRPLISTGKLRIIFLLTAVPLTLIISGVIDPHLSWTSVVVLIAGFFVTAVFIHQKLFESRPDGAYLTMFYLTMSVGGALGGVFNSILAPVIFNRLHEGIATIGLAALLILGENTPLRIGTLAKGLLVGAAAIALAIAGLTLTGTFNYVTMVSGMGLATLAAIVILRKNTVATFMGLVTSIGIGGAVLPGNELFMDRSFFGLHHVADYDQGIGNIVSQGGLRVYSNGSTIHGAQRLTDLGAKVPAPIAYYDMGGAIQQIYGSQRGAQAVNIGIVGLGVGVLSCYRQPGQKWHYYEIDKMVDELARNEKLFTFMSACGTDIPTYLGDARMVLARQDIRYDILMLDAYSSDSIPVHLTTIEAFKIYLEHLNPDGLLVFHVSNRFYQVDVPLARAAEKLGLVAKIQTFRQDIAAGKVALDSVVVIMGRTPEALGDLGVDPRWIDLKGDGGRIWTDDYANPLSILR